MLILREIARRKALRDYVPNTRPLRRKVRIILKAGFIGNRLLKRDLAVKFQPIPCALCAFSDLSSLPISFGRAR